MVHRWILAPGLLLCSACGDLETTGGFADPCQTGMSAVLGCAPRAGYPGERASAADACRKLVSCGILAETHYQLDSSKKICAADSACSAPWAVCKLAVDGKHRCHVPYLDRRWCHLRLTQSVADPCDNNVALSAPLIHNVLRCIADTSCAALGLPFASKVNPADSRSTLDMGTCSATQKIFWTATACDHGWLQY